MGRVSKVNVSEAIESQWNKLHLKRVTHPASATEALPQSYTSGVFCTAQSRA